MGWGNSRNPVFLRKEVFMATYCNRSKLALQNQKKREETKERKVVPVVSVCLCCVVF